MRRLRRRQSGASVAETVVVLPALLFMVLGVLQAGFVFHAKSSVNYAVHEAARAGTVSNARMAPMLAAFEKAMLGYYGGGRTAGELADALAKVTKDLGDTVVHIEILSPTRESFDDYASPKAQEALKADAPVIPSVGLDELQCPRDVPGCNKDPKTNKSGQTLSDANLLKLKVTYGIPPAKQMPLVGLFYTWALDKTGAVAGDAFAQALVKAGRIPVVAHTVMRMQSDAIRNDGMASIPGPGNDGKPGDPGTTPVGTIPDCPLSDPTCKGASSGEGVQSRTQGRFRAAQAALSLWFPKRSPSTRTSWCVPCSAAACCACSRITSVRCRSLHPISPSSWVRFG